MKRFLVTGTIIDANKMTNEIMKEHKAYTTKWMKSGHILLTGLAKDYHGVYSVVQADSEQEVKDFYAQEPFFVHGIQTYTFDEINLHFVNKEAL